jgi:hypothetical protein
MLQKSLFTFIGQEKFVLVERSVGKVTVSNFKIQEIIVVTGKCETFNKQKFALASFSENFCIKTYESK